MGENFLMNYKKIKLYGGNYDNLKLQSLGLQISEQVDMARHYACSMDIHSSHQTLLVCGVAKVSFLLYKVYVILTAFWFSVYLYHI